jgi:hypothetical protein
LTTRDRVRKERAEIYLATKDLITDPQKRRELLIDAIGGLQSTDDPSLVPLWHRLCDELDVLDRQIKESNNEL